MILLQRSLPSLSPSGETRVQALVSLSKRRDTVLQLQSYQKALESRQRNQSISSKRGSPHLYWCARERARVRV